MDPHVNLLDFLRWFVPGNVVSLEFALSVLLNDSPVLAHSLSFYKYFFPLSLSLLSCDVMVVV